MTIVTVTVWRPSASGFVAVAVSFTSDLPLPLPPASAPVLAASTAAAASSAAALPGRPPRHESLCRAMRNLLGERDVGLGLPPRAAEESSAGPRDTMTQPPRPSQGHILSGRAPPGFRYNRHQQST